MDEVGGEWSAEQLMEAHRAGKQQEAFPRTADDKDGEGEARAEETEEENLERLKAENATNSWRVSSASCQGDRRG